MMPRTQAPLMARGAQTLVEAVMGPDGPLPVLRMTNGLIEMVQGLTREAITQLRSDLLAVLDTAPREQKIEIARDVPK